MKKCLALLLSVCLILGLMPLAAIPAVAETGNTEGSTESGTVEWKEVASLVELTTALGNGSKNLRLMSDIDLGGKTVTEPIAVLGDGVTLDGNGKSIVNFSMNAKGENDIHTMSLFGTAAGKVTVKNLTIGEPANPIAYTYKAIKGGAGDEHYAVLFAESAAGSDLTVSGVTVYTDMAPVKDCPDTAMVSGFVSVVGGTATFENCNLYGSVKNKEGKVYGDTRASGYIAEVSAGATVTMKACTNNAEIRGGYYTGGFIGKIRDGKVSLTGCANKGNVFGEAQVGGMVGVTEPAADKALELIFENCQNLGAVTATGSDCGGLIGKVVQGTTTITGCLNKGNISGNSLVGGLIGIAYPAANKALNLTFDKCQNLGAITANNAECGGFLGKAALDRDGLTGSITFTSCVNRGEVKAGSATGGFIGKYGKTTNMILLVKLHLENCLNTANVTSSNAKEEGTGGFIGYAIHSHEIKLTSCVNTGAIRGTKSVGGIFGFVRGWRKGHNDNTNDAKEFKIKYAVNAGTVTGTDDKVCGIGGYYESWSGIMVTMTDSFNLADVTTTEGKITGPILYSNKTWAAEKGTIDGCGSFGTTKTTGDYQPIAGTKVCTTAQEALDYLNQKTNNQSTLGGQFLIVGEKLSFTEAPALLGVQKSGTADGKFSARFSAILKNYDLEAYQEVGFAVTLGDKTVEKSGTKVYSTLSEGTGAHLASEFGGSYFFTLNLTDIPATGTQTVTVRVFAVNSNGEKVYESITYTATFANGECEIAVSANA